MHQGVGRDHTKLRIFQRADALVDQAYLATREFPPAERYGLQAQIRRAAVSVPANIAEGSGRESIADYTADSWASRGAPPENVRI